ncbi:MAG: ABC transporter ATP-binding protein [Bifidobacteriaceae bacterium]|jgi:peptide/nickel transport system ATP-binding protein|nr:ABC transporter ATP-binding protein [Bifidobacteriaceae bacterium]
MTPPTPTTTNPAAATSAGERVAHVAGLSIEVARSGAVILDGIDLDIARGEIVGIAGETGSGKSTLALALAGYHSPALNVSGGAVEVAGHDMLNSDEKQLRSLRGDRVAYVPQDPASALSPALRLRDAFGTVQRAHGMREPAQRAERMSQALGEVNLPCDAPFAARYPHELSGGQIQRIAIAIAFGFNPDVVVLDEPTTGLDVATKHVVVSLAQRLSAAHNSGVAFVSHDLALLLTFTHRIVVLHDGKLVEDLPTGRFLTDATHPYTRELIAAARLEPADPAALGSGPADGELAVIGLDAAYGGHQVTHGIDLQVRAGECLALVGESGSGKTTVARAIAGLHPEYQGQIRLGGEVLPASVRRRDRAMLRHIQYVFQNPYSALAPRRAVGRSIALAARGLRGCSRAEADAIAAQVLERVGLRPDHGRALPHALSGGQRQRAALARALAGGPSILICDEVTSSLDATVQRGIVALLADLRRETGLTMVFITHDLSLARAISDTVVVLKDGRVVESGPTAQVFTDPQNPYTQLLVDSATPLS